MHRTVLTLSGATLVAAALVALLASGPRAAAQSGHAGHGASAPAGDAGRSTIPAGDAGRPTTPAGEAGRPTTAQTARKILYYRNPMGLADTSPVPKKDGMGMDYVPVYDGEDTGSGTVSIGTEKIQKLGVRTEVVSRRSLSREIRAVGTVAVDERSQFLVTPRFEAWIDTLSVDTTGASVRRGDVLMEVYAPELVLAQQEYLSAKSAGGPLAEAALQRLRNLGIAEEEIARLAKTGKASRLVPYRAGADGVVLEKTAVRGMRFMPGDVLYRIADLSSVWVIADVFEQDLGAIRLGQTVDITVTALPGRRFTGRVAFVYPTLAPESRTAKIRVELANPEGVLRPNLYATVRFGASENETTALAVPDSAVLDTGKRQAVLVEVADGRFQPREVRIGERSDGWVRVDGGLAEGERVVVRANFLIDSESNLRAALGAFAPAAPAAKP